MRLPLISPSDLTSEQSAVYDDMRAGIEQNFQGFSSIAENGALMGPWNPGCMSPVRKTNLGANKSALLLAFAAETRSRSRYSRHRCEVPSSL